MDGFRNLEINNFRGIEHLTIDDLCRGCFPLANRNYENTQHWNLDAEYMGALKGFLEIHLI